MINESDITSWRNRLYVTLCNNVLGWIPTQQYKDRVSGMIEYGMRSAARDEAEGNPPPGDWRVQHPSETDLGRESKR